MSNEKSSQNTEVGSEVKLEVKPEPESEVKPEPVDENSTQSKEISSEIEKYTSQFQTDLKEKKKEIIEERNKFLDKYSSDILQFVHDYITKQMTESESTVIQGYLIIREDGLVFMLSRKYADLESEDKNHFSIVKTKLAIHMQGMNGFKWKEFFTYNKKIGIKSERINLAMKLSLEYLDKNKIYHARHVVKYKDDSAIVISYKKKFFDKSERMITLV